MKGIEICDIQPDGYRGICRQNQMADYMEDKSIGAEIKSFLDVYVNDESQEIECTVASLCESKHIAALLCARGANSEVITYNDEHESAGLFGESFIGYDVCSENLCTSPIALELILDVISEYDTYNCPDFFDMVDSDTLHKYSADLNQNMLFATRSVAEELTSLLNSLVSEKPDMFDGDNNFSVFAVFSQKSEK